MKIAEADFAGSREAGSLQLPYDRLKTPALAYRVSRHGFVLNNNPVEQLIATGKISTAQHSAFLLAVCGALFYRYSGQATIPLTLFSVTLPNREWLDRPLALSVSGETRFLDLLDHTEHLLEHIDSQSLAGACEGSQAADRALAVVLGEGSDQQKDSEWDSVSQGTGNGYDLQLILTRDGVTLTAFFVYNALLFEATTIKRLAGHLQGLIFSAVANPQSSLAELSLFREEELDWLHRNGAGASRAFPPEPVFREVERQALLQPAKTAVRFQQQSLSYRDLNRCANQLAHYLLARGIGADKQVIVCVEPSLDIAVALLAIFKAGAVYVPLNPAYPRYRVEAILEDTAPELIITQTELIRRLDFGERPLLCLDQEQAALGEQPDHTPEVEIDPSQTAYIYYTSGTTGKPKGVMASHANLINYIRVSQERYGFNSSDVMPAMASFTFSISMFELLSPLVAGGTLLLLDRGHILDPQLMVETLKEISFIHAGPSLLKKLVAYIEAREMDPRTFSGIRHLSSGGDMIPPELLGKLQQLFSGAELYVIYGCSEVSCMGCTWFIDPDTPVVKTYVGKPFANVSVAVLDEDGNIVPIGVAGDVCIGGDGVVKGYLRRPELTAEKFFCRDGVRFYRTGDRGRINPEGNLELLGRRDFQVQLRGMRIELGEIEYHLRQAPGVRDGVVMAGNSGPAGDSLIAYFVADKLGTVGARGLREHLQQYLPDYMVPGFYRELEALPLNHNLKVDRNALPGLKSVPPAPEGSAQAQVQAPQTASERELADIWCQLLRKQHVDRRDNFLVIGGDSLLAMELIASVKERLGVTLDGMDILRESLQVLAADCDRQLGRVVDSTTATTAVAFQANPCKPLFFGPGNSLYGLLHTPLQNGPGRESQPLPVLICPPLGQEYARCYFLLKTLADTLSREGITVLRFDYFGTGDSLGDCRQATLERWRADVAAACEELKAHCQSRRVRVIGIRTGATLALTGLDSASVAQWVLWDPVVDGALHYRELSRMHREKIRHLRVIRNWKRPRRIAGAEELVGATYSKTTLAELRACSLIDVADPDKGGESEHRNKPLRNADILISERDNPQFERLAGAVEVQHLDVHCGWYESFNFNKTIIDKKISQQLVDTLMAFVP